MSRLLLIASLAIAAAAAAEELPASREATSKSQIEAAAEETKPAATAAANRDPRFRTMDRLELGTTSITGNQELPKVMYVVPWKKAQLGDLAGRPARSLIDEILAPVDRDVFRREVGYFETLDGKTGARPAQGETPVTPESARP